jgi:hypothetical protein
MSVYERPAAVIDPTIDPDRANAAVRQLTAPQSQPLPLFEVQPSNLATMPGGLLDTDGQLWTEARIREINGADEEAMARELRSTLNVAKLMDLILRRTVEAIGPYDPVPPAVLNKLLVGDRSALILAIRILTFGSDWEVTDFPCQFCGQTFGVVIQLDSLDVRKLDNPRDQEIEVPLRNGHQVTVALMTGDVQLELAGQDRTLPEETTITIDRCVRRLDGNEVIPPVAQKMGMADRHKIIQAMAEAQPGPQLEEVVTCYSCGKEGKYTLSLIDLFR